MCEMEYVEPAFGNGGEGADSGPVSQVHRGKSARDKMSPLEGLLAD